MDEDDEIDILGDFNLETSLNGDITRLLGDPADYSLPSNWLLDFQSSATDLPDGVGGDLVFPVKTNYLCESSHSIEAPRDCRTASSLEEMINVVETAKTTTPICYSSADRYETSSPRKRRIKKRNHHYSHIKTKNFALNKNSIIFNGGNGEIVKLEKIDEDLITVDIDSDSERPLPLILPKPEAAIAPPKIMGASVRRAPVVTDAHAKYSIILQERLERVYSLPPPTHARVLDSEIVLDEEERLFPEFFPAQGSKNANSLLARYLKIRNHLVSAWNDQKPAYLTKTSCRLGLKNCGDVNLIGRIHAYLEQKGVINFGCPQCHYKSVTTKRIDPPEPESESWYNPKRDKKRKLLHLDKEDMRSAGITIAHSDDGLMSVTAHSENSSNETNNSGTTLIHCEEFTSKRPAPFSVTIDLRAILVAEMHSHGSSSLEIMGLLGGKYNRASREVEICSAAPCVALSSSSQHCDMCPVSQFEAIVWIQKQGHDVVGWYHSHPFALPDPSAQDISTQKSYQSQFVRSELPFLGLILSPYSCYSNRCFVVVDNKPYSMEFKTVFTALDTSEIVNEIRNSLDVSPKKTDFSERMPNGGKTLHRKCVERMKKTLAHARGLPNQTKNRIITEVEALIGPS